MSIEIHGDGIAAWCCARLLTHSEIAVSIDRGEARRRPWILLSDPIQKLLCEIAEDDLFRESPRIRKRYVQWGAERAVVDHSAVIVDEAAFLDELWGRLAACGGLEIRPDVRRFQTGAQAASPPHQILCGRAQHSALAFGTRMAQVVEVSTQAHESCWIESLEQGWLFLVAGQAEIGSLIAVGASPQALLESSRLIAPEISAIQQVHPPVSAFPRITDPMFGDGWLACGSAAMALDPLCGDGAGHAVREAILATAVIRGGREPEMLEHYQSRLRMAFERHLTLCRSYYSAGNSGPWWDAEIAHLNRGLDWSREHAPAEWRYRLEGVELVPI